MSDMEMPDLGGAPMPGEGLDMSFLSSLGGQGGGGGGGGGVGPSGHSALLGMGGAGGSGGGGGSRSLPTVQSGISGPGGAPNSDPGMATSVKATKSHVQPAAREDFSSLFSPFGMSQQQKQAQPQPTQEELYEQQRQQMYLAQQAANPEPSISFWKRYETHAVWAGLAALLAVAYLLYKQQVRKSNM